MLNNFILQNDSHFLLHRDFADLPPYFGHPVKGFISCNLFYNTCFRAVKF